MRSLSHRKSIKVNLFVKSSQWDCKLMRNDKKKKKKKTQSTAQKLASVADAT
jgi:hypothetical protein